MKDESFDRQAFVTRQAPASPPPSPLRLLGPVLFLGVAGVVGLGAYQKFFANASAFSDGNETAQLLERLEAIEQRLGRIEKRRKAAEAPAPAAEGEPAAGKSPAPVPPLTVHVSNRPARDAANVPTDRTAAELRQQLGSLRADVSASQEAWEASADRLSSVAGEVRTQRAQIAQNAQSLSRMAGRFERTRLKFELPKKGEKQRVGPVWLLLRATESKKQLYTMRIFLDDRWVEWKDRALYEPVEFYVQGAAAPAELVISEIRRDGVAGYLSLPAEALKR